MKRNILTACLLLFVLFPVAAQSLQGSYFFERSVQRNKLNAAFAPQVNYISVPALGMASIDVYSNVGLANFHFPTGAGTATFMHPDVSADQFLGQLPAASPYVFETLQVDLLGAGLRIGGQGYLTVALSANQDAWANVPNDVFRYAKQGGDSFLEGPALNARGYGMLSVGYSHDLSEYVEGLRVGGRLKLLAGLFAGGMRLTTVDVSTGSDAVTVTTAGDGWLSGGQFAGSKLKLGDIGFNGFGIAADLGVEYRLKFDGFVNGINLSAAVNDLGTPLRYNKHLSGFSIGGTASYTGFGTLGADTDYKAILDQFVKDLKSMTEVSEVDPEQPEAYRTGVTARAGLEVPFLQEMMSVGMLYTHYAGPFLQYDNLTASCNLTPLHWLNLGVHYTFLGPANRLGFYAEFTPNKIAGFFFGLERATFKTNRQHLAISNFTGSSCFGVNVVF